MEEKIIAVVMVTAGLLMIIFRNNLAKDAVEFQIKKFGFNFGEKEINANKLVNIAVGIFFVFFGVTLLFGNANFR